MCFSRRLQRFSGRDVIKLHWVVWWWWVNVRLEWQRGKRVRLYSYSEHHLSREEPCVTKPQGTNPTSPHNLPSPPGVWFPEGQLWWGDWGSDWEMECLVLALSCERERFGWSMLVMGWLKGGMDGGCVVLVRSRAGSKSGWVARLFSLV